MMLELTNTEPSDYRMYLGSGDNVAVADFAERLKTEYGKVC